MARGVYPEVVVRSRLWVGRLCTWAQEPRYLVLHRARALPSQRQVRGWQVVAAGAMVVVAVGVMFEQRGGR